MTATVLFASAAALAFPFSAHAQPADADPHPQPEAAEDAQGDHHDAEGREIIVTGFRRNREDVLQGTSVVSGAELDRDLRPTIGESLARQPGISATSFGPNSSRPVIRGQQGERVRVLSDGIGSLDVANTSVDHAVAINPLTADRIEILRGPATLLFGSSASGGVVNVIDSRIPRSEPENGIHVDGILTYGSASEERSANGTLDVSLGGGFVAHLDGNYTRTSDLRIGGFVLAPEVRAQALASPDAGIRALADLEGRLPNTAAETSDIAAGLAWIDGDTNVGFSVNQFETFYGVPIRYSLDPAVEAEGPSIDLRQQRIDGRAEIGIGSGFLESVRFRGAYADYRHFEVEDTGEIATTFLSDGYEGRLEFVQRRNAGGYGGGFGAQYFQRDFFVEGEEKFLPPNQTRQFGLFALQSLDLGRFRAEVGGRFEHQESEAEADADLGNPALSRAFDVFSASAGASYGLSETVRLGINLSRNERSPSAEELYANGPHAGTQAFEVGNPDLTPETSYGAEATLRLASGPASLTASAYYNRFDGYIYQSETGEVEDDLPVFETLQADSDFLGFELEGQATVATIRSAEIVANLVADYVEADIEDFGAAPRIPPLRLLGGVAVNGVRLDGRVEVEHVFEQDRVAPGETVTDGFTLVNASLSWQPLAARPEVRLTFSANNLFDVDARRHASFLKDFAPLAGRDLRVSARFGF